MTIPKIHLVYLFLFFCSCSHSFYKRKEENRDRLALFEVRNKKTAEKCESVLKLDQVYGLIQNREDINRILKNVNKNKANIPLSLEDDDYHMISKGNPLCGDTTIISLNKANKYLNNQNALIWGGNECVLKSFLLNKKTLFQDCETGWIVVKEKNYKRRGKKYKNSFSFWNR